MTGFGGNLGNKGGVGIRMRFYDTTICFVCSHLAVQRHNVAQREADFRLERVFTLVEVFDF